jgi:hypothetical protein
MSSVAGNTDSTRSTSQEGTAMEESAGERLERIRQRMTEARETQKEVFLRLAETEERVAATFDRLAHDSRHSARRAELAREARTQAARLRAYVSRLTSEGVGPEEPTVTARTRRRVGP